jgi:hypothetical protein
VRFRRRPLNLLRLLLALVVLACLGGAICMYLLEPQTALLVAGVGFAVAFGGYLLHRDAVVLFVSVPLYPILALGVYALHVLLDVPVQYLLWVSLAVFGLVVLVLTADEVPL